MSLEALSLFVISQKNIILYKKSTSHSDINFQQLAFLSLDIFDEKVNENLKDNFLGILFPDLNYKIYGYVTNNNVKLVLILDIYSKEYSDIELKQYFKSICNAYVDAVSNPFYEYDTVIKSKKFETVINSIVAIN